MDIQPFETLTAGAIGIIALVMGWVQFAKQFGIKDSGAAILTVCLGAGLAGLREAMARGLIPEAALPWISVLVVGLGGAMAAMGLYKLGQSYATGNAGK